MASVEENKRIIERFLHDLGNNIEGVEAALADDAQWVIPQLPELFAFAGTHTKEAFVRIWKEHHHVFPEGKVFTIIGMTAEDDRVAVEVEGRGDSIYGPFDNRYHFIFVLRDGKVVLGKEYADSLYMNHWGKMAEAKARAMAEADAV